MKTIIQKTKSLLILLLFFISFLNSYGQSITTGTVSPYLVCLGNTIVVPFVTTGNFNQNDFFRVQLSTTTGNFNSTSATIGSMEITSPISGTFSGSITATIPTTISASTQYRVRVVYVVSGATSPSVIGSKNTSNLILSKTKFNPSFTLPTSICSGTALTLPTTSNNNVTGTWSPAFNNTVTTNTTTNYTFTPTAGLCANVVTRTITVNANIIPTFNSVNPVCAGSDMNPLPTLSTNNISGTWSPALDNTATTTYTFTPNAGSCALTTTTSIAVNPYVTATFDELEPKCAGENIPNLPQTSLNGIEGVWTPALDNQQTTTYTFTPNSNFCSYITTASQIINPVITPLFNQIDPICIGDLFTLPTLSENGISGSWSPEINNSTTTTYTFTPSSGICPNNTTMTVVVNPLVTPSFNQLPSICVGDMISDLPLTSLNGIEGSWSPALNNEQTTTYTFAPNPDFCAVSVTDSIVVTLNTTIDTTVIECSSYTWHVNGETYTSSGTYSFVSGCLTKTLNLTITQSTPLELPGLIEGQAIGLCSNGNSNPTFTINPIEGATSYVWTVPQGAEIISGQGTTSVTLAILSNFTEGNLSVSAVNPCVSSQPRQLYIRSVFYTPLTPVGQTTGLCSQGLSSAVFEAAIVPGITNYVWSVPDGTSLISGQGSSTIQLSISESFSFGYLRLITENACGSSAERIVILRSNLAQPGLITGTTVGLCEQGTSTATYSIPAQAGASSYTWTVPQGTLIQSGQGTNSIELVVQEGFTAGNLSVVANTECGSSTARNLTISSVLLQPGLISGPTTGLCPQGISTATYSIANQLNATSYTWIAPEGTTIISGQGTNTIELSILEGFSSGNLSVAANNNCGSSALKTIIIRSKLNQLGAISGTTVGLCSQQTPSVIYSVSNQVGAESYTWTAPFGTTIESGQGTNSIVLSFHDNFSIGNLNVSSNNHCGSSNARVISIRSTPGMPGTINGPTNNLCQNGINNPTYTIAAVAGASSYTWTTPVGTSIISGQGTTSITLNISENFVSGNLSVVTNNICGSSNPKSLTLSSILSAPGTITGTRNNLCSNGINNPSYSISAVAGASSYTWIAPTGATIASGQGTTSITLEISDSFISGNLSVIANNSCGSSIARTLALTSIISAPLSITGTTSNLCPNGISNPTYTIASISGASSYTWNVPEGASIISGQGTTSIILNISENFISGNLSVVANNACGSSSARTLALSSNPLIPGSISGPINNLCPEGISSPTYTIAAVTGASSYTWTAPAGTTILSGQGTTSVTLSITSGFNAGALTVAASNQCGTGPTKSITISSIPLTPSTITGSTTPCGTESYSCSTVSQATSYTWTVPPGMEIITGQGTNSITVSINESSITGNITVKAANNCKTGNARSLSINSCNIGTRIAETINNDPFSELEMIVFPNPTNDIVAIELSNAIDENLHINLINLIGQKVSEIEIQKGYTIGKVTLNGMPAGTYLLQATKSNGQLMYSTRVIKQ